jgi:hypothetical protein
MISFFKKNKIINPTLIKPFKYYKDKEENCYLITDEAQIKKRNGGYGGGEYGESSDTFFISIDGTEFDVLDFPCV